MTPQLKYDILYVLYFCVEVTVSVKSSPQIHCESRVYSCYSGETLGGTVLLKIFIKICGNDQSAVGLNQIYVQDHKRV